MNYLDAILLAIVEGLSEFLPISSTGHLILTAHALGINHTTFVKSFEIFIQLGAILAVVVLYWKTLLINFKILQKVMIAFIPTGILGLLLYSFVKEYLIGNTTITLFALLIGGIILIIIELFYTEKDPPAGRQGHHTQNLESLSNKNAFIIGIFQSLAMIPGVSRSASTIIGALLLGVRRKPAVEFSFLLAVPTLSAATLLDLVKMQFSFSSNEWSLLTVGLIGSFFVAIVAIKFFLSFIEKHTFIPFGIYRIVLAVLFWIFVL